MMVEKWSKAAFGLLVALGAVAWGGCNQLFGIEEGVLIATLDAGGGAGEAGGGDGGSGDGSGSACTIGGAWQQLDLAGNVWEWNVDWWANYGDSCTDCASTSAASYRVIRGGSFSHVASYLLAPSRFIGSPSWRLTTLGLRCARTP